MGIERTMGDERQAWREREVGVRETWICCPTCWLEGPAVDDGEYLICRYCEAVLRRVSPDGASTP